MNRWLPGYTSRGVTDRGRDADRDGRPAKAGNGRPDRQEDRDLTDDLAQLVRDLMRLGVELRVEGGQPSLHVPDGMAEPYRSRAYRAARAGLDVLAANRDRVAEVWRELARDGPDPTRCPECRAWVFQVPEPVSRWAFCESRYCPHRSDPEATLERWKRDRDRRQQRESDRPLPD